MKLISLALLVAGTTNSKPVQNPAADHKICFTTDFYTKVADGSKTINEKLKAVLDCKYTENPDNMFTPNNVATL